MNPVHLIQSLINTESLQKATTISLKPGQLLYGRVVKFLPNETAMIQIGNARLFAHLKASLTTEDSYWFEVRSNGDEGTQLKVVEGKGQSVSADFLLKHFQLPETKQNLQLIQFFLSENVPFTKEQLKSAASWINHSRNPKEFTALEWMIKKDLPFTKDIFQSIVAVQDSESLSQQLGLLESFLDNPKFNKNQSVQSLKQIISTIVNNHSFDKLSSGTEVKHMLQTTVQSLGLEYENKLQLWSNDEKSSLEPLHSLKPLLMEAISELGASGKELEPLLNRLTGMQLISQDLSGSVQQMVMQVPLSLGGKQTDATLQWNGRKTSNGQIDPNYCHILFYLDLQSMNQTVIDMQIQNKVIHIAVINDMKGIDSIITALSPALKEKLESIGYQLSFINVVPAIEKSKMSPQQMSPTLLSNVLYRRLDVKV